MTRTLNNSIPAPPITTTTNPITQPKVYLGLPALGKTYFCDKYKDRVYNGDCFMIKYGKEKEYEDLKGLYHKQIPNWEDTYVKTITNIIQSKQYELVILGIPNQGRLSEIYENTKLLSNWYIILPEEPLENLQDLDYIIERVKTRGNTEKWVDNFKHSLLSYIQLFKDFSYQYDVPIKRIKKGLYLSDIADELF